MPVQAFSFPIPETRFFQVGQHVYKFKIRRGSKSSGDETLDSGFVNEELENAVRVILMSLDNLHPFTTQHFSIFPYKSRWERVSELRFKKGDKKLFAYPFLITLYVEINEPIPSLTVNSAHKWVPSRSTFQLSGDRDSGLHSPQLPTSPASPPDNEPKRRRTEEPQEGPLSLDHRDKKATHSCLQELPNVSGGAEESVCDNEDSKYADSEESSPGATSPELHVVEQHVPDSISTDKEKAGVLVRLASIVAFPFSLLFKRT
ncbi:membrane-anchored junction protein isoform X1 [Tachysurus vachellii]|uniref:membrane-anchored junction protein isoform X1 n=1 Tax=Tachysurus vachellii TaxID=175792 RepID=UPI00296AB20B|nr:membrane-anchored junction protein isoform X1 [Tachysurus vachellii]XP_060730509.1 membrane-anchored junction protein isoform X1 [Tachysurus vachellii]